VIVATHGWWPWLLTLAIILIVIVAAISYFAKRRKTT
jgi:HAMP domain-containing protein